jgi:hypothetical protein
MAAVTLTYNTPVIDTSEASEVRRRVNLPGPCILRIYCADSAVYLELVDAADASARGAVYETYPAGGVWSIHITRGEIALSAATSASDVELTARKVA